MLKENSRSSFTLSISKTVHPEESPAITSQIGDNCSIELDNEDAESTVQDNTPRFLDDSFLFGNNSQYFPSRSNDATSKSTPRNNDNDLLTNNSTRSMYNEKSNPNAKDFTPERNDFKKTNEDVKMPCNNVHTNNPTHLFAAISKVKRSLYIKPTSKRIIHVEHYAQSEEDLYTEEASSRTNEETYEKMVLLFFIHGVGGSSAMWEPQISYFLSQGYEILSIDLLGHGLSSKPRRYEDYHFNSLANDVLYIFDRYHKQRNVLIGHSYGSSFCTLLSKERPNRISKTVLISGGGPTTLMPERCSAFCLPFPLFVMIRSSLVKVFRRMAFHIDTSRNIRNRVATFQISAFALKAIMQGQLWSDADVEYHAGLTVPVLLIYGSGDRFVSLEEEIWMEETIYGAHLEVIENAGHMVTLERPTKVNEVIHNFLNRDSSTRSTSTKPCGSNNKGTCCQDDEKMPKAYGNFRTPCESSNSHSHGLSQSSTSVRSSTCFSRSSTRMSRNSMRSSRKTMM